ESGCVANVTASRVSANRMRKLRLFQRDAYISVDYQARQAILCRRDTGVGGKPTIDMQPVKVVDDEPLRLQLESFVRAVGNGSRPEVTGEDGLAALTLAHQVLESISEFVQRHERT
ncbi:MAG TPA: gfo/Idh/MocA family oxidoreductase, partial [Nitrospirales bacterium]|nr:gfo/Idh/MocA family oxidoreductase [Nitrospirales bacterium]